MKKLKTFIALLALLACCAAALAADTDARKAETAVRDYEGRIEKVAEEIDAIRKELEALTREMVEGETGRVFIFLKGKASDWGDKGISLTLDGREVFGRPLTTAELDVLSRDLPLELLEIRLGAGEHEVALSELGARKVKIEKLNVKRASIVSWTVNTHEGKPQWSEE